ncbi:MAG: dephospho-CoA kinase [Erysipelotrichia bacterium]|nr:dephospho-CoA kinase [Erysipelotrichia bacterium]
MTSIGLTGTIGSGKTTVSILLRRRGMHVFNADQYSRICYYPSSPSYQKIIDLLGTDIIDEQDDIDRHKVAELIFADEVKRQALNDIIHPEVKKGLLNYLKKHKDEQLFFAEIPLLFECGWQNIFDRTALVTCSREIAISRLMKEREYTEAQAAARIAAQFDIDTKRKLADDELVNNGTLKELDHEVAQWIRQLKAEIGTGEN